MLFAPLMFFVPLTRVRWMYFFQEPRFLGRRWLRVRLFAFCKRGVAVDCTCGCFAPCHVSFSRQESSRVVLGMVNDGPFGRARLWHACCVRSLRSGLFINFKFAGTFAGWQFWFAGPAGMIIQVSRPVAQIPHCCCYPDINCCFAIANDFVVFLIAKRSVAHNFA